MPMPQRAMIGSGGASKGQFVGYSDAYIDATNVVTYTFSTKNFGAPHPKRCVIVALACNGTTPSVTSVVIGGVTATAVIQNISTNNRAGIWIARVPKDITGDVAVTLNAAGTNCSVAIYTAILNSTTASATNSALGTANVTLTIPTNGFAVMVINDAGHTAMSDSAGMIEDFDAGSEGSEIWYAHRTTSGSYTSVITGDTATGAKAIAAWSMA